ncbi:MAG: general secretion pathway protein GspK [Pseudobdellovibrionaceae bacterium]
MKFTRNLLGRKNQKGVALLIAVFTVVIITYLVSEILYDTNVEYIVNSQAVNRLKAYYAAKSGLQISLLRIKIYNKVQKQVGGQLPEAQKKLLEMIWQFPLSWPPMIPEEASGVDKDMIKDKVKESAMDAVYVTSISDEGSKIDLNDLGSPSKGLREITKKLLMQIFENRMKNDEAWARTSEGIEYEKVINNMIDWVDGDSVGSSGSDERSPYGNITTEKPYPPNRSFRTVDEIRMVAGMTDDIFDMLRDRVTVYGTRAINPNHATGEVLKALDVSLNDEVITKILTRRNDPDKGPFKDEKDFWGFVNAEGGNVSEEAQKAIPLVFTQVTNFRIRSTGEFGGANREIEAVVFDFSNVGKTIAARLQEEANTANGVQPPPLQPGAKPPASSANKSNEPLPKGPPRIVYFIER